jgi:hypothetical protein
MIDLKILNNNMKKLNLQLLYSIEGKEIGTTTKIDFIDNEGFKYSLSQQNICTTIRRNGILARYFQHNPYTFDNINNYLKQNNIQLILITKEPKSATCKLEWKCTIHSEIFERCWNSVKNGSLFCKECEIEDCRQRRCNTIEYVKNKAFEDFNIKIISDIYVNNEELLDFICNKHKNEGIQHKSWGNILTKSHPCLFCSKEKWLDKVMKSHDEFIKQVKEVHGDKYIVLSEYQGANKHVQVYCTKCKSVFSIKASHLTSGHGCGICTKSKGEEHVKLTLDKLNYNYIREYRFDDCRGIQKTLPFDFYLEQFNLCIEFQGIQHFEPVEIFGGEKQFKIQQFNDNCKREYCKSKNINLLEIPYLEEKNIENILTDKLKQKGLDLAWEKENMYNIQHQN